MYKVLLKILYQIRAANSRIYFNETKEKDLLVHVFCCW